MTTADRLLEQMFSWIHQKSLCADQLVKLARELESLREKCNVVEAAGNSVAVLGAACVIGAGITLLTGGAAAPVLGLSGGSSIGLDTVVSVTTKLVEDFRSSSTMKEAKETEEKSKKFAKDIKRRFKKLKSKKKKEAKKEEAKKEEAKKEEANRFTHLEDLDRHILTDILRAVAGRSGVKINIDFRMMDELYESVGGEQHYVRLSHCLDPQILVIISGVLAFFTLELIGNQSKFLFDKGAQQLINKISVTGMKKVLKGGTKLVGGAIGMAFALDEAIDSWKDLIKNNHVTEASQSLRDKAEAIRKICQAVKDQFKDMK